MTTYSDKYPYNIEAAQKLTILWSPEIEWNYDNGYPTGNESIFNWSDRFMPYIDTNAGVVVNHVWMKYKIGDSGKWSLPTRINYPEVVRGEKGEKGERGEMGYRGIQGLKGDSIIAQYSDATYQIVPPTSTSIVYIRMSGDNGRTWTGWLKIVGSDGVGSGGIGIPSGGLDGQLIARTPTGYTWINKTDVYNDAMAVLAMGVLANSNPLNHNRYTDSEALAVFNSNIPTTISGTLPIEYDNITGIISHSNNNGSRHIPVGGGTGEGLATDGFGNYSWVNFIENSQLDDTIATVSNLFSGSHIMSLINGITTYGIRYSWADSVERDAQIGMTDYDLGVQQDNRLVYQYLSGSWNFFFALDGIHNHNDLYTLTVDLVTPNTGGLVDWTNIANVPIDIGLWQKISDFVSLVNIAKTVGFESNYNEACGFITRNNSNGENSSSFLRAINDDTTKIEIGVFGTNNPLMNDKGYIESEYNLSIVAASSEYIDFGFGNPINLYVRKALLDEHSFSIVDPPLVASNENRIVQFDNNNYLVAREAQTGFNLPLGTTAGTVSEGNHSHNDFYFKGLLTSSDSLDDLDTNGIYIVKYNTGAPNSFPDDTYLRPFGFGQEVNEPIEYFMITNTFITPYANDDIVITQVVSCKGFNLCQRYLLNNHNTWSSWSRFTAVALEALTNDEIKIITPSALKTKAVWIVAPSLLNDWTGTVKYRNTILGDLELLIDVYGGTADEVFQLPFNIAPAASIYLVGSLIDSTLYTSFTVKISAGMIYINHSFNTATPHYFKGIITKD